MISPISYVPILSLPFGRTKGFVTECAHVFCQVCGPDRSRSLRRFVKSDFRTALSQCVDEETARGEALPHMQASAGNFCKGDAT